MWRLPATDTFVCDSDGEIAHQNVVITYSNPKKEGKSVVEPAQVAPKGHGPVHDAWQNHFSVFGAHDVENVCMQFLHHVQKAHMWQSQAKAFVRS